MPKLIELRAENFKRLRAVTLKFDGKAGVFEVCGRNAAGKSSALDSLAAALGGTKLCPKQPLRRGANKGFAEVKLDDGIVVRRTFTAAGGGTLTVKAADGKAFPSPQSMLDSLVGRISFDPLAFVGMRPDEQARTVKELAGLDFTDLDRKRAASFDERTDVNREVKRLQGALSEFPEVEGDLPDEPQTVGKLNEELSRRRDQNRDLRDRQQALAARRSSAKEKAAEIEELEARLDTVRQTLGAMKAQGEALAADLEGKEPADEQEIIVLIDQIEEVNAKIRAAAERRKLEAELAERKAESEKLTGRIGKVDEDKAAQLATAKMPIDGLAFGDEGITYGGLPFEQASSAERLRVSMAVGLAMNPKLPVILIRDGSLLDDSNLALIAEMAETAGAQVLLERVGEGGECAVVIEDGMVAGDAIPTEPEGAPPDAPAGPPEDLREPEGEDTGETEIVDPGPAESVGTDEPAPDDENFIDPDHSGSCWAEFNEKIAGNETMFARFLADEGLPTLDDEGAPRFEGLDDAFVVQLVEAWDSAVKPRGKKWQVVTGILAAVGIRERGAKQFCRTMGLIAPNTRKAYPWSGLNEATVKQLKTAPEKFRIQVEEWVRGQA